MGFIDEMNAPLAWSIAELDRFLERGDRVKWPQIGKLLLAVESTEAWRDQSSSFNGWVRDASRRWNIGTVLLWRYRAVVKNFLGFLQSLDLRESVFAEAELPSPESLALLMSLSARLDLSTISQVTEQFFRGELSRAQLRQLQATTKRHRDKWQLFEEAEYDHEEVEAFGVHITGLILRDRGIPIGVPGEIIRAMVAGHNLSRNLQEKIGPKLTIITDIGDRSSFHYLHWGILNKETIATLKSYQKYYDKIWLILPSFDWSTDAGSRLSGFNLLLAKDNEIELLRRTDSKPSNSSPNDIARLLLNELLKSPAIFKSLAIP